MNAEFGTRNGANFRIEVDIKGMPYVFKGPIISGRQKFDWKLFTPDMENYKLSRQWSAFFDNSDNEVTYVMQQCAAGYIRIDESAGRHSLYLVHIRSNTPLLTVNSPYHDAPGVGGFLLRNALALADLQGGAVHLTAYPDPDGRLGLKEVVTWYGKHGFQKLPIIEGRDGIPMVRPIQGRVCQREETDPPLLGHDPKSIVHASLY